MDLQNYGSKLYDFNVTITRLSCLALLDNSNPFATDQIVEMTDDLAFSEYAVLFGLDEAELQENDMVIPSELVMEMR